MEHPNGHDQSYSQLKLQSVISSMIDKILTETLTTGRLFIFGHP